MGSRGELFTYRMQSDNGRRSYFFNVKEIRGSRSLSIVESIQKATGGFDRHQVHVYSEDVDAFILHLEEAAAALRKDTPQERPRFDDRNPK